MGKKVSVIMPTYNCAAYIEQAIQSVQKQSVDWELIIVDDASTDETEIAVKPYLIDERIHYYRNERNKGVAYSRNMGVAKAVGEYVAYLDADDWWEKDKLEKQCILMEKKNTVLCYTGRELYSDKGKNLQKKIYVPKKIDYKKLMYTNVIPCSSVLLKTEVAKEFPMEHDEVHEDYLMWLRITKKYGQVYGINEPLLKSRLALGGKSRDKRKTVTMTYGVYCYMGLNKWNSFFYTANHLSRSVWRYMLHFKGQE